jgi:hypothetical protein
MLRLECWSGKSHGKPIPGLQQMALTHTRPGK